MILDKRGNPYRFAYDATVNRNRRRQSVTLLKSEDRELTVQGRKQLVASSRDVFRNFSIAGWMVRRHLDYVSTFDFHARTGNDQLDADLEAFVRWWSRPQNCDAACRLSLPQMIRTAESERTIGGDVFLLKLRDGYIQAIEGERVRTPSEPPNGYTAEDFIHGVITDRFGAAIYYAVHKRLPDGTFEFERLVNADYCYHHGYFARFDQIRGVSPMAAAINGLIDCYESFDYALAKAKVSQLFAMAVYRDSVDSLGYITGGDSTSGTQGTEPSGNAASENPDGYTIDFTKGPQMFDMNPGEKAEVIESKTPSSEFQTFTQAMISAAIKSLDLPYSFYDESFTNYSGSRQALLQYQLSAKSKQQSNRDLLNNLTMWRLSLAIQDGFITLPRNWTLADVSWEWVAAGVPWIDPLKEVQAALSQIEAGLNSRQRISKERGQDFFEIAAELAAEQKYLQELGLPVTAKPGNVQITEVSNNQ